MKYIGLVWAQLWRRPKRTWFTVISIAVAFLLFAVLIGFGVVLDQALSKLDSRLFVVSKYSQEQLPLAYRAQIEAVPGIKDVSHMAFFGGYYKDRRYGLPIYATDVTKTFHIYRSLFNVPEESLQKMRDNRTGVLIARRLAVLYGWKVGDRVSLSSTIWTNKDGTSDYPVDIVGLFESKDGSTEGFAGAIFMNYDYLNESRMFLRDSVQFFIAELADPKSSSDVMKAIDAKFSNSPSETHTMTEQALLESQLTTIADIELLVNAIVAAAFFALLFVAASTMAQSVRERSPEFAMLKTLGFSNAAVVALVLAEGLLLCLFAAVVGLLVARVVFLVVGNIFAEAGIPWIVILQSFGIAAALALISSALPALRAGRLTIIEALALKR